MTLVTIDLGDVAGGHDPDDHVIIRAEAFRESLGGGITSTAEVKIPLVDGVGQAEVEPGPVVVSFRCRAVADTREKRGVVPASGTVGIERVLENAFEYLPPVVNRALETIKDAVAAEVDAIKWDRGHVPLDATSISDLAVGSWRVSNDARAAIIASPGLRLGNVSIGGIGTSRTAFFVSQGTASEPPMAWVQAERGGVWSGWDRLAFTDAMEAADTALGQRITDEKWRRPTNLGSSANLDDMRGASHQGLYTATSSVQGLPSATPGWVEIRYESVAARTSQRFWPSSPTENWALERTYSGSSWGSWRPTHWRGQPINSGTIDTVTAPGQYPVTSSNVAGIPISSLGSLEVVAGGSGAGSLLQRYVTSSSTPSVWVRPRAGAEWGPWVHVGGHARHLGSTGNLNDEVLPGTLNITSALVKNLPIAVVGSVEILPASGGVLQRFTTGGEIPRVFVRHLSPGGVWGKWNEPSEVRPRPVTYAPSETVKSSGLIPYAVSADGLVSWNYNSNQLRQSLDGGHEWAVVRSFAGQSIEMVEELANGELILATTGTVDGQSSMRRVWVSTGYDRGNPSLATWDVKITGQAPMVKFVDWCFYQHDNILLMNEYGPKSGYTWAGGSTPIAEGQNARYTWMSEDYGVTWRQVFDLNAWLIANGRPNADGQHLHGVAWDKYWNRIWITFGDNLGGAATNGIIYSDNKGATWQAAHWTGTAPSVGQVVGIQPMKDCIVFAGDMTPSGFLRIDRAGGKTRPAWDVVTGFEYSTTDLHLCHSIVHKEFPQGGEVTLMGFSQEGTNSPSFIIATRDGYHTDLIWVDEQNRSLGLRTMAGLTDRGELIAAINTGSGTVELRGVLDVFGSDWSMIHSIQDRLSTLPQLEAADTALGQRIDDEIPAAVAAGRHATILPDGADIKALDPGTYITRSGVSSQSIIGAPPGVTQPATIQIEFTPTDRVVKSITWTEWASTGSLVWVATMSYGSLSQWARLDRLGTDGGTAHLNDLTVPGNYYFVTDSQTSLDQGFPVAKGGLLSVDRWRGSSYQLVQKYFPFRHEGFFLRFFYSGQPYEGTVGSGWMEFPTRKTITADTAAALTSAQQYADQVGEQVAAEIRTELPPARSAIAQVACLGDSLTAGYSSGAAWAEADAWPSHLATTLGVEVAKLGFSGATTDVINIRTGVTPITFTVTGGVIPGARYSNVALTTGQRIGAWGDVGENFNSYGWIAGRYGLLKFDGTSYIFTTSDVAEDQEITTAEFRGEFAGHEADTIVYMAGRNDITKNEQGVESSIVEHVLRANADVMEWATPRRKQVVLMGTITRTDETPGSVGFEQVREIRHRLRLMYPEHFLDVQGYLLSQDVWAHTGITPTQADLDAQARGMTPPGLFDDVTHYSRATAQAVAEHLVGPFLVAKGWVVPTVPVPQAAGWAAPLSATHDTTLAIRRDTTVGTRIHVGDTLAYGRIGWRDITSLITGEVTSGRLLVARTESTVWLHFDQLVMGAAGSGTLATLPTGWRPMVTQSATVQGVTSRAQVTAYGYVQVYNWSTAPMIGTVAFMPDGTWPTLYPGTPA